MPGRIGNSPGPQVITPQDRPVPAARRSSILSNKSPVIQHQGLSPDVTDVHLWPVKGQPSMAPNATNGQSYTDSRRPSVVNTPQKPVSTVRPQSALGPASPITYDYVSQERQLPSLGGVDWGGGYKYDHGPGPVQPMIDGRKTPVNSSNFTNTFNTNKSVKPYSTHNSPAHERSRSYGDGISLGPALSNSNIPDSVYGTIARQPASAGSSVYDRRAQTNREPQTNGNFPTQVRGPKSPRGQENFAFVPDDSGNSGPKSFVSSPSPAGHDLRHAWQRLYGGRPDPASPDQTVGSRNESFRLQNGHPHPVLTSSHQGSPQASRPTSATSNTQPPFSRPSVPPATIRRPSGGPTSIKPAVFPQDSPDHDIHHHHSFGGSHPVSHGTFMPPDGEISSGRGYGGSTEQNSSAPNTSSHMGSFSSGAKNLSTFKPEKDRVAPHSPDGIIGPAARYPEMLIHHSVVKKSPRPTPGTANHGHSPVSPRIPPPILRSLSSQSADTVEFKVEDSVSRPLFRSRKKSAVFLDSGDELDEEEYVLAESDYGDNESDQAAVAHAYQRQAVSTSGRSTPASRLVGSGSPAMNEGAKTPDLLRANRLDPSGAPPVRIESQTFNQIVRNFDHGSPQIGKHLLTEYARSRSLEDVRESGNESTISFDVENTVLTVEPSDQSEMGTLRSYKTGTSVRAQLNRLEDMYSRVMKTLEETKTNGPRTRRRWSIGSSDTSSLRQQSHHNRHSRSSNTKFGNRDVKAINRRFQRLESHVITLARSVAHLSSELRNQSTLSREIENVKREVGELRLERQASQVGHGTLRTGRRESHEHDKHRYWSPFFANPKRVGKLTRFFGQEPPLLELFLKKLGYEKYLKNFESEHISMIELPYMTEERLEKIGVPMGPRLRILQEAQACIKKGDFDVYFV